nr:hypothetical protein [Tanacetum cinerariifolium]
VVECREGIIGIAHPAVAVVPVAGAAGGLGQASGASRDDGAGVFVLVNLEGQRRADNLRLVEVADAGAFHPLAPVESNVIGAAAARQLLLAVLAHRAAGHAHARRASERLNFPDEHQRLVVALVLQKARRKVGDAIATIGRGNLRAEHVGVGEVPLLRGKLSVGRLNAVLAAFLLVEQRAKHKTAIEARPAKPANGRVGANECQEGAVADHAHVI